MDVIALILMVVVYGVVVEFPVLVDASEIMRSVFGDLLSEVIVDVIVM